MQPVIAHYYCELADSMYNKKMLEGALEYFTKALSADRSCARASLLYAKILMEQGEYKSAITQPEKNQRSKS